MTAQRGASFPALGTLVEVCTLEPAALPDAVRAVRTVLAEVDRACSRFRDDSELSRVNAAAGRPVPAGPMLMDALDAALRAADLTGGLVDPTLGGVITDLGYDRDFAAVRRAAATGAQPGHPARHVALARRPSWREVGVDRAAGTVTVPAGASLDLGATGKAFAADRAALHAAELAGSVLVSIGGDLRIAGAPAPDGWTVRVADSHAAPQDAQDTQTVLLHDGGMATSSTTVRRWKRGTSSVHHLLDPRTAAPAEVVWRTVSVTAASCLDANTASTAAIISGEAGPAWLERVGLPARLVRTDGRCRYVNGWPVPVETPALAR
jgi:thiamine biosynthesis lipoprotein